MKKTTSHATGRPSSVGVVKLSRTRLWCVVMSSSRTVLSGGFYLFLYFGVYRPSRDVAVHIRVRLRHGPQIGQLQRAQQIARRWPCERVRVPVTIVVLEPLRRLGRAPGIDVGMGEIQT